MPLRRNRISRCFSTLTSQFYKHCLLRNQQNSLLKPIYLDSSNNPRTRSINTDNPNEEKIRAETNKRLPKIIKKIEKNIDAPITIEEKGDQVN